MNYLHSSSLEMLIFQDGRISKAAASVTGKESLDGILRGRNGRLLIWRYPIQSFPLYKNSLPKGIEL
ncbi:hypothetical protein CDAR_461941, partial [Caerostris darwini]